MNSRALGSLLASALLSVSPLSTFASDDSFERERPPFADEVSQPGFIELGDDITFLDSLSEIPEILPTAVSEPLQMSSETQYASVEIPAPAPAIQDVSTSAILNRLETLEAELHSLKSETIVTNLEEKLKKPTYKLGGRIHVDHWSFASSSEGIGWFEHPPSTPAEPIDGEDPEDRLGFRRVRLELQGENPANMFWRFQIDFAKAENSEYKDVYIGWDGIPGNQKLIVGHQKRPIGLDHWNSSRFNIFLERPFVVEAHNEDARRLGIAMRGESDSQSLFWQYGVFVMENIVDDGAVIGDDLEASLNARLGGSLYEDEAEWFHWALAGQVAFPDGDVGDDATNQNEGRYRTRPEARSSSRWLNTGRIEGTTHLNTIAGELMYNRGPLNLCSEAMFTHVSRNEAIGTEANFYGYYVQAGYFLTGGDHMSYKRSVGSIDRPHIENSFDLFNNCDPRCGAWQVAARYSMLDVTDGDIGGGVGRSMTYALNWYFSPYARIQFNLIRGSIAGRDPVMGFTGGDYTIYGTRYGINF